MSMDFQNPPFLTHHHHPLVICKVQAQIRFGDGPDWGEPLWFGYEDDPWQADDQLTNRSAINNIGQWNGAYWRSPEMQNPSAGSAVYALNPFEVSEDGDIIGSQMRYRLHPNFYRALSVKVRWSDSTELGGPIDLTIPALGWSDWISGGDVDDGGYIPDIVQFWCGHFLTLSPF